jgi:hypothetical protein
MVLAIDSNGKAASVTSRYTVQPPPPPGP